MKFNCALCGNDLEQIDDKIKPCQVCQDGAFAHGYDVGYEDSVKGKPKKLNDDLVTLGYSCNAKP